MIALSDMAFSIPVDWETTLQALKHAREHRLAAHERGISVRKEWNPADDKHAIKMLESAPATAIQKHASDRVQGSGENGQVGERDDNHDPESEEYIAPALRKSEGGHSRILEMHLAVPGVSDAQCRQDPTPSK